MADEITTTSSMSVSKGNLVQSLGTKTIQLTLTADPPAMSPGIQIIGTTHETVSLGDVTSVGQCYLQNLDDTNYVEIGVDVSSTFYPVVRLEPGQATCFRMAATAPYAQADTAAVNLLALIMDA